MSIVDGVWYLSRERENDYCFLIFYVTLGLPAILSKWRAHNDEMTWQRYSGRDVEAKDPKETKDT